MTEVPEPATLAVVGRPQAEPGRRLWPAAAWPRPSAAQAAGRVGRALCRPAGHTPWRLRRLSFVVAALRGPPEPRQPPSPVPAVPPRDSFRPVGSGPPSVGGDQQMWRGRASSHPSSSSRSRFLAIRAAWVKHDRARSWRRQLSTSRCPRCLTWRTAATSRPRRD